MEHIAKQRTKGFEAIDGRGLEADGARVLVVAPDGRHLADLESESRSLDQDLRVEDEVVAILEEWDRFEKASRVRPVAGVVFGQLESEYPVLGSRQEPVAEALPPRHAGLRRIQTEP